MKIGLFGGTFDPVHNGHVALVKAALAAGLDRVIVMPSGQPPHKSDAAVSMAGYRFELACQAFADLENVAVSDLEILRAGPSYTMDTIHQLQTHLLAEDELVLVMGSDILFSIEKWYQPEAVMQTCQLLLASRGGVDSAQSLAKAEDLRQRYAARINFFPAPRIELSSTQIRTAVPAGQDIHDWVPEKVARSIRKNSLYRFEHDLKLVPADLWPRLDEIERQVWPLLDRKRLLHSLNVMVYSLHLAHVHVINPEKACIAALLHDCGKCLPKNEMTEYASLAGDPALLGLELAHGPAGAWLAKTRFGIDDADILRAIHYHTTGCAGMSELDKIIFIADKVEPARTYDHLDEIRRLAETDLDASLRLCLGEIDLFLKRESLTPHPYTQVASDELDRKPKH